MIRSQCNAIISLQYDPLLADPSGSWGVRFIHIIWVIFKCHHYANASVFTFYFCTKLISSLHTLLDSLRQTGHKCCWWMIPANHLCCWYCLSGLCSSVSRNTLGYCWLYSLDVMLAAGIVCLAHLLQWNIFSALEQNESITYTF